MSLTCEYLLLTYLDLLKLALERDSLSIKYIKCICDCMYQALLQDGKYTIYNWNDYITSNRLLEGYREDCSILPYNNRKKLDINIHESIYCIKKIIAKDKNNKELIIDNVLIIKTIINDSIKPKKDNNILLIKKRNKKN